jgi:NADPH-dependent glutamate synthase beta subunit-like oxidoreductase
MLPVAPDEGNGKRIALIGAGPASLTVANDLLPLGYEVVIYEKLETTGGLMRTNIPAFRLPVHVLDEEIDNIINMGADLRLNTPVESLRQLVEEGDDHGRFDAVFVGSGAPQGRELDIPGRDQTDQVYVGISWLEAVAFGHINSIAPRVVIIGGGNTAMDCCRTAKRIGGDDVKVVARKPYDMLRASDWELEGAEEESIDIITNHSPARFVVHDGNLTGVVFEEVEWSRDEDGRMSSHKLRDVTLPCDAAILAVGQENSFPFVERDMGIEFDKWGLPVVDKVTFESTRAGIFFGGDAAFGPLNIIWAVAHGHEAAISIHNYCNGVPATDRLPRGMNLISQRMGTHEWSYSNTWDPSQRKTVPAMSLRERFVDLKLEVEHGFDPAQAAEEAERCLNCDAQTDFTAELCIECDACIDVCPVDCLTITDNAEESELRTRLTAPALNTDQPLFVSEDLPQTGRVMVKDEDVCIHCGLCAERCPTAAWDMKKSLVTIPYAGNHNGHTDFQPLRRGNTNE